MAQHSATRAERDAWIRQQIRLGTHRDLFSLALLARAVGIYGQSDLAGIRRSLRGRIEKLEQEATFRPFAVDEEALIRSLD